MVKVRTSTTAAHEQQQREQRRAAASVNAALIMIAPLDGAAFQFVTTRCNDRQFDII